MKESRASSLAAEHRPAGTTPLERSWAAAAVLLAWLGTFAAFSFAGAGGSGAGGSAAAVGSDAALSSWGGAGPAVIYAATALLIGLAVFCPARPSAADIRVSVYALPVLLLTVLLLLTEPGIHVGLTVAFLPPWALFTALYGLRGGLPTGGRYLLMYAAAALVAVGAGYLAVRIVLGLAFAGLPLGLLGWLLPLLPLLLLLQTRYRRNRRRTLVEIVLSALAAVCGTAWFGLLDYGTGWSPDLGVLLALPAWIVAVLPTAVLLALGYLERFDTAEYP
ncbi:hypothetical protein ACFFON_14470 [Arthrobacter citreus]|uniref:hypothetical protein n=1 Tax=Arthrobacter TaxID=1663 RepID=UPI0012658889|nr:hypothetical protein [Arthrobacter gandavensis]